MEIASAAILVLYLLIITQGPLHNFNLLDYRNYKSVYQVASDWYCVVIFIIAVHYKVTRDIYIEMLIEKRLHLIIN